MRRVRFLSLGLALAMLVFAAVTYASLPDRIPMHLDLAGKPTRFEDKSPLKWFLLPGIGLALYGMIAFISARLTSRPGWFNFPEQDRFLRLPPEYHAPVIAEMRVILELLALMTLATMLLVQYVMWRITLGAPGAGISFLPLAGVILLPVALLRLSRVSAAVEEQERRWRSERPEGPAIRT